MKPRPPRSTRTDTHCPYTTLFRSGLAVKEYSGLSSTQRLALPAMEAIALRAQLIELGADNFLETSLDPYAAARSAYLQRRQALLLDPDGAPTSRRAGVHPDRHTVSSGQSMSAHVHPGLRRITQHKQKHPKS